MSVQENKIFTAIRLRFCDLGGRLFRNHVGLMTDKNGRVHRFGLCRGSSDGIGFLTVDITPEMVGRKVAVFAAIEAKTPVGKASQDQENFIRVVKQAGGIAGIARSAEDVDKIVCDFLVQD